MASTSRRVVYLVTDCHLSPDSSVGKASDECKKVTNSISSVDSNFDAVYLLQYMANVYISTFLIKSVFSAFYFKKKK